MQVRRLQRRQAGKFGPRFVFLASGQEAPNVRNPRLRAERVDAQPGLALRLRFGPGRAFDQQLGQVVTMFRIPGIRGDRARQKPSADSVCPSVSAAVAAPTSASSRFGDTASTPLNAASASAQRLEQPQRVAAGLGSGEIT